GSRLHWPTPYRSDQVRTARSRSFVATQTWLIPANTTDRLLNRSQSREARCLLDNRLLSEVDSPNDECDAGPGIRGGRGHRAPPGRGAQVPRAHAPLARAARAHEAADPDGSRRRHVVPATVPW